MTNCNLFSTYEKKGEDKQKLRTLATRYCRGRDQLKCVRRRISKKLGGPENLPRNMMPDGKPWPGTTSDNWPDEIKDLL